MTHMLMGFITGLAVCILAMAIYDEWQAWKVRKATKPMRKAVNAWAVKTKEAIKRGDQEGFDKLMQDLDKP